MVVGKNSILCKLYNLYVIVSIGKTRKKKDKNLLMVQTTHHASFGPILQVVIATFPKLPHCIFCKYNLLYIVVSVIVVKKR